MSAEMFCPVTGKAKFASATLAAQIAKRDARRAADRRHRKGGLKPYRCTHCNAWHLGRVREHRKAIEAHKPTISLPSTQGD